MKRALHAMKTLTIIILRCLICSRRESVNYAKQLLYSGSLTVSNEFMNLCRNVKLVWVFIVALKCDNNLKVFVTNFHESFEAL